MTDKYKKIDRQYVLSDSSVNEYGFRLLTSGYQLDAFQKNPIGYYMHRREDGIVLKWEDLLVDDDKLMGTPVINFSNGRGTQTCDEVENGFLNAASVGHIVVLEYSTDKDLMLPGQTGPTITRWYNKECSLVDIPGNCNALTRLYDAHENELNLVDLNISSPIITAIRNETAKELCSTLKLVDTEDEKALISAVQNLVKKAEQLELEHKMLSNDKQALQQQIDEINNARSRYEISAMLDRALEDKKITTELKNKLVSDYAGNPEGLLVPFGVGLALNNRDAAWGTLNVSTSSADGGVVGTIFYKKDYAANTIHLKALLAAGNANNFAASPSYSLQLMGYLPGDYSSIATSANFIAAVAPGTNRVLDDTGNSFIDSINGFLGDDGGIYIQWIKPLSVTHYNAAFNVIIPLS